MAPPAAAAGLANDLLRLARAQLNAVGPDAALPLLRQAADAGSADAQIETARVLLFLLDGSAAAEALDRLHAAERAGHPAAGYLLAWLSLGDHLLPRCFERIDAWIRAAAEAGIAPAQRALGLLHGRRPAAESQSVAIRWLQLAASRGDAVSGLLLAERARRGEGMPANPLQAAVLDRQLEAAGHSPLPEIPASGPGLSGSGSFADLLAAAEPAALLGDSERFGCRDDVLGAEECRFLIAMARPYLRRSRAIDPISGEAGEHALRSSSDASIDPLLEDFYLRLLQLRLARLAGLELRQAEHLIVLRYRPGEQYRPHRDYLSPAALAGQRPDAGQRLATVCAYLNPVESGGETDFPLLGHRAHPAPGRAIAFANLDPLGQPDPSSLHAGLPVVAGEKWLATLWLRQGHYRRF